MVTRETLGVRQACQHRLLPLGCRSNAGRAVELKHVHGTIPFEMDSQGEVQAADGSSVGSNFSSASSARLISSLDQLLPVQRSIMSTETIDRQLESANLAARMSPIIWRIQCEFNELPGLKLTEAQARRLWALDGHACHLVLRTLIERRFLRRTASSMYVRAA